MQYDTNFKLEALRLSDETGTKKAAEQLGILRPSFGQEIKKLTNVCYLIGRSKQDGKEQKNIHGFFQERSCA